MGRKGQRSADLPSFALSDRDPCAQAAQLKQIVAVTGLIAVLARTRFALVA